MKSLSFVEQNPDFVRHNNANVLWLAFGVMAATLILAVTMMLFNQKVIEGGQGLVGTFTSLGTMLYCALRARAHHRAAVEIGLRMKAEQVLGTEGVRAVSDEVVQELQELLDLVTKEREELLVVLSAARDALVFAHHKSGVVQGLPAISEAILVSDNTIAKVGPKVKQDLGTEGFAP